MIIIDYFNQNYQYLLNGIIIALTVKFILKHHKPIMDFVGKVVKFSQVYIVPLIFMLTAFLDQKYYLQEKYILAIGFCGFAMIVGAVLNWNESNNDNQQEIYTLK